MTAAVDHSVVSIGLPGSGKTTYLAALWHLIQEGTEDTKLKLASLPSAERAYLNGIASAWRQGKKQIHTPMSTQKRVELNLKDETGRLVCLTFPDVAGEDYRQIWEVRECDPALAELLGRDAVLLFMHADDIKKPLWLSDILPAMEAEASAAGSEAEVKAWHPKMAPTQVKLIDLLSLLSRPPLDRGPRRIAIMLSAWDKVIPNDISPENFLADQLPMLDQFIRHSPNSWAWRIYGVSAQGGDYDPPERKAMSEGVKRLVQSISPSTRIQLFHAGSVSHDLTDPLAWLMGNR